VTPVHVIAVVCAFVLVDDPTFTVVEPEFAVEPKYDVEVPVPVLLPVVTVSVPALPFVLVAVPVVREMLPPFPVAPLPLLPAVKVTLPPDAVPVLFPAVSLILPPVVLVPPTAFDAVVVILPPLPATGIPPCIVTFPAFPVAPPAPDVRVILPPAPVVLPAPAVTMRLPPVCVATVALGVRILTVLLADPNVVLPPTNSCFVIAIPPAVVREPPFVELVASVELLIPIPPESVSAPVVEVVLAVALDEVITPLPRETDPEEICKAYGFVIARVPAIGGPAMYILAALVAVPVPFKVACPTVSIFTFAGDDVDVV
jgi:hypothetical protein